MASRRKGRILAFQALYCWDVQYGASSSCVPEDLLEFPWSLETADDVCKLDAELQAFAQLLLTGTIENIKRIDKTIQKHLQNWDIVRLNRVDLAILRMSVYTLMFQTDIASSIVIDEAIELSKEFGTDDSYRFVNGVLDAIRKSLAGKES